VKTKYEMPKTVKSSEPLDEMKALGIQLGKCRQTLDLSQRKIAEHLGYMSSQFVSNWERGLCGPPVDRLSEIVDFYGLDRDEVIEFLIARLRRRILKILRDP